MKVTGKQEWSMERGDIHGPTRLYMRVVFGLTKDKVKGKFSIQMPVGMKGTGETIKEKVRECSFKTILLSGFSIHIFYYFPFTFDNLIWKILNNIL
jgi:hypothetical protein